jgi:minor extracellular protease Epr
VSQFHQQGIYGRSVSIYIIDTGLSNTAETFADVNVRSVPNPMGRKNTHGSFVAAIVGTKRARDKVPGIAPESQIYLADVSGSNGIIYTSALVSAIRDAIDLRVDIISISLGTNTYDQKLEDIVAEASRKGILVFAAAGNCSCRAYEFPAACDSAISVGSIDLNRSLSPFNTRNDTVAVFAPGQNIAVPGSKSRLSGTSFAVPFASGLAALELSRRRIHDPKATLSRLDAIGTLRTLLGTDDSLTYSRTVGQVQGSFRPDEHDALIWLLLLSFFSGIIFIYSISLARRSFS